MILRTSFSLFVMNSFPSLHTERLTLRGYRDTDFNQMVDVLNNENITKETANIPYPFTNEDALKRVEFITKGFENKTNYIFVITKNEKDSLIGQIGLHLDVQNNKAEIGYWISEAFWGKGIATESLTALLKFGFEELNLNKIFATHFLDNPSSGKVLIKNGMIKEGLLKDEYKKRDKYCSVNQYRLTKEEYLSQ